MAMYISDINRNKINYVLLGANNDYIEKENDWVLHGNILGIYETADTLAGKNHQYWMATSGKTVNFKEIKINTSLGHGFLYRPIKEGLVPTKEGIIYLTALHHTYFHEVQ